MKYVIYNKDCGTYVTNYNTGKRLIFDSRLSASEYIKAKNLNSDVYEVEMI